MKVASPCSKEQRDKLMDSSGGLQLSAPPQGSWPPLGLLRRLPLLPLPAALPLPAPLPAAKAAAFAAADSGKKKCRNPARVSTRWPARHLLLALFHRSMLPWLRGMAGWERGSSCWQAGRQTTAPERAESMCMSQMAARGKGDDPLQPPLCSRCLDCLPLPSQPPGPSHRSISALPSSSLQIWSTASRCRADRASALQQVCRKQD